MRNPTCESTVNVKDGESRKQETINGTVTFLKQTEVMSFCLHIPVRELKPTVMYLLDGVVNCLLGTEAVVELSCTSKSRCFLD